MPAVTAANTRPLGTVGQAIATVVTFAFATLPLPPVTTQVWVGLGWLGEDHDAGRRRRWRAGLAKDDRAR